MTLQEAKDQIAKNYGPLIEVNSVPDLVDQAAELYARSKWDEACIKTRLDDGEFIFSGANPSEINEDFYTRPKPKFQP